MSVRATTWVWYDSNSEGADRLVLLALADFADEDGRCFGSWGTLQRKTKLARSTIARCIKRLEACGELLLIEPAKSINGRNLASTWKLPVRVVSERDRSHSDITPRSHSDITPGLNVTLPRSDSDTPTQSNVNQTSSSNAPAISSPSLPSSEKATPKPKRAPAPKFDPSVLPLPHGSALTAAWAEFAQHRREIKAPLTPTAAKRILDDLGAVNVRDALEALRKSVKHGWRGVFVEKSADPVVVELPPKPKGPSFLERSLAADRVKYGKEEAA